MKAISLWQPWASLVAVGEKKWETRGYMRSHRGLLAIHAAKIPLPAEQYARNPPFSSSLALHGIQFDDLPFGALVAVVNFTEIITAGQWMRLHCKTPINPRADREYCFGDYAPGRFAWKFEDVHRLAKPIPYTGRQGIFNLDDATAAAIEAELGQATSARRAHAVREYELFRDGSGPT